MSRKSKKILIAVVGPTAVGKTRIAIELAKHYRTEIISADSRQFYKELSIGTAKPSKEELSEASHHFISSHSIDEIYSAGDFEKDALHKIDQLFEKNDVVVLVGGSGLFVRAVCEGLDDLPKAPESIRQRLNQAYETQGLKPLQERLQAVDPDLRNFDIQNPQRVIRALEVYEATGKPISHFQQKAQVSRPFNVVTVGLNLDRALLYEKINQRVELMIRDGLVEEARSVVAYRQQPALLTVGYSELFDYFDGKYSLQEAIDKIKQHSRRYAKRQITWFNKYGNTVWFSPSELNKIVAHIDEERKKSQTSDFSSSPNPSKGGELLDF